MRLLHLVPKLIISISMSLGFIMIAAGLGLMDLPPPVLNTKDGVDKFAWAADFSGVPKPTVLIVVGACKVLAFVDIWFLHVVPQLACICFAIMMLFVAYGHYMLGDDMPPPFVMGGAALICAFTWPAPPADGKKGQ
jgi:hypothetical protein